MRFLKKKVDLIIESFYKLREQITKEQKDEVFIFMVLK